MAKGIIHAFEIVHVQRQQAQGLASGSSSLQCVFKPLMKMAAIGEAGQPIVARSPADLFSSGLGLRDVQMSAQEASVSVPLWSLPDKTPANLVTARKDTAKFDVQSLIRFGRRGNLLNDPFGILYR